MRKIALLLVIVFTLSMSLAFADIIVPSGEIEQTEETEQTLENGEPITSEETQVDVTNETSEESGSSETTKTTLIEEDNELVKTEVTSNPLGGVLAIVVVIILVVAVALVSKK